MKHGSIVFKLILGAVIIILVLFLSYFLFKTENIDSSSRISEKMPIPVKPAKTDGAEPEIGFTEYEHVGEGKEYSQSKKTEAVKGAPLHTMIETTKRPAPEDSPIREDPDAEPMVIQKKPAKKEN